MIIFLPYDRSEIHEPEVRVGRTHDGITSFDQDLRDIYATLS